MWSELGVSPAPWVCRPACTTDNFSSIISYWFCSQGDAWMVQMRVLVSFCPGSTGTLASVLTTSPRADHDAWLRLSVHAIYLTATVSAAAHKPKAISSLVQSFSLMTSYLLHGAGHSLIKKGPWLWSIRLSSVRYFWRKVCNWRHSAGDTWSSLGEEVLLFQRRIHSAWLVCRYCTSVRL